MQNSVNDDQEKLDHSEQMAMEDPTAVTIDLLRGQLLSERAISRTARQRADELSKRVVELEEQLKLVNAQRRKAEKATSEVLAILENHGISDFSEVYDSGSDQDGVSGEPKDVDNNGKGVKTTSRSMRNKAENLSGSELGGSPAIHRSSSWKSFDDGPSSRENVTGLDETRGFSSSAATVGPSTIYDSGRSHPHLNNMESRSSEAEVNDEPLLDPQGNLIATRSGDTSHCSTDIPKILRKDYKKEEERVYSENSAQNSLEDQQKKEADSDFVLNGSERNVERERAFEHKARFTDQFEAEENAQREWEEKFKGSPDSGEHGNHSDITEERDDIRADTSEPVDTVPPIRQGRKSEMEQVAGNGEAFAKDLHNRPLSQPSHGIGYTDERQYINSRNERSQNSGAGYLFPGQDNLEANSNEKMKPGWSENNSSCSASYQSSEHQAAQFSSFHGPSSLNNGESSGNAFAVVKYNETSNGLGGVLDALQQAKLSLKHKLNTLGSPTGYGPMTRKTEPATSARDLMEMPVGCGGLFRVPTSFEYEAHAKTNLSTYYPDSESSRGRYHSQLRVGDGASERYASRSYLDSSSSVNNTHRALSDPYVDNGMGVPLSSNRYMYPSYVDMMPRLPTSNEGSSRTSPLGMGGEDRYSEYNDRRRPDLYRR